MIDPINILAFTTGLMSSFHCIGMCGPIALALPGHRGTNFQRFTTLLVYNSGRAFTYAMLGMLLGSIGSALVWMGYLSYLSVCAGVGMLAYVFWPKSFGTHLHSPAFWQKLVQNIKGKMARQLQNRASFFLLGSLNGLLPCGMVYLALISSIATGSILAGASYMLIFGIGTFPAMMAVGFARQIFTPSLRSRMRKITPIVVALAGVLLVIRGVVVQYPSRPKSGSPTEIPLCHGQYSR